ncbi:MAG: DUF1364 domain-containing protein [Candidatus Thiodiazotropha sp. (ex Troendleina suluensis)]|nr:DUF1364 domain-containing protein [Candidatus Thiodiazotropha sp. (ex Troendleina suluensis)]
MTNLRKEARGRPCQVRVPGICKGDPATVVLAHLNGGGGAMKHHDLHGAWACYECHQWLDVEYTKTASRDERDLNHLQGVIRTQQILIKEGKL